MDIIDKSNIDIKSIQPSNSTDCNDDKKNLYETRIQQIIRRSPGGDKSESISMVSKSITKLVSIESFSSHDMFHNNEIQSHSGNWQWHSINQIPYHILNTMLAWSTI